MEPIIRNRVAESPIEVFNLEDFKEDARVVDVDLAAFLDGGFILREKAFREQVKEHDWSFAAGRHVAIHCTTDAIIAPWAYMLIAARLSNVAAFVQVGSPDTVRSMVWSRLLAAADFSRFEDRIVVIKGCGNRNVPETAYAEATLHLQRVARKIMYGEPCSSVPVWRRPN